MPAPSSSAPDVAAASSQPQSPRPQSPQPQPLHDPAARAFASDNYAGVHPEVMAALAAANGGHQISYGEDVYTEHLQQVLAEHFGAGTVGFPVFNGTGANVLSLQALSPRWGAVVCAETAHIHTDENGAPERVGGLKLLTVPTPDGKLTPELIDRQAWGFGDEHRAQPLVVSITQTTELGTCYQPEEIAAIADHAHRLGMKVHLDGSRLANAAATLDRPLRDITTDAGVDVISLGGTKNGALGVEAVVLLADTDGRRRAGADAADALRYLRKQDMQLNSKMRFASAQLIALLEGDLYLRSARHANAMAQRLAAGAKAIDGVRITQPVQANGVFAVLDKAAAERLRADFRFYDWNPATGEVRWMCSWDTTEADVDAFLDALRRAVAAG
ncbi:threonine aldolase family protein [Nakamurella aerolata]|uniref:Low specificity L-threonine aldolase n=1 Tax=Nakamurella aerolata TaxID=1656892 RepID=A0A849AG53_9ACTN|nr:low specificity L-threonine aldolase [Nakamurella aerolata]NNG35812.1 low specificity L-threonine aldolase [Nakamurella aerolata]